MWVENRHWIHESWFYVNTIILFINEIIAVINTYDNEYLLEHFRERMPALYVLRAGLSVHHYVIVLNIFI